MPFSFMPTLPGTKLGCKTRTSRICVIGGLSQIWVNKFTLSRCVLLWGWT